MSDSLWAGESVREEGVLGGRVGDAVEKDELLFFLRSVDALFPVPLSDKVDLEEYADKLLDRACLVAERADGKLAGLAAGYVEHLTGDFAYVAVVGVRPEHQRKGIAKSLVSRFVELCRARGLKGVHLYTDASNAPAIRMYEKLGFGIVHPKGDPRAEDVHFAMRLDGPCKRLDGREGEERAVLVTAIGSFSAPAVIRALTREGFRVVGCDIYPSSWVAPSRDVSAFFQAPLAKDARSYIDFVCRVCSQEAIEYVVPLTDVEVDVLDEYRGEVESLGARVCISPHDAIAVCRDKMEMGRFAGGLGLPIETIPTEPLDPRRVPGSFPVVCKPVNGRSSEGLRFIETAEQWRAFAEEGSWQGYIVQPRLEGDVVTVDVVRDSLSGDCFGMPRIELLRTPNGAGTSVRVFSDRTLSDACCELAGRLGIEGCVNFEFLKDGEGRYWLLECNPRFSGGVAFSEVAGYGFVSSHMKCFSGGGIEPPGTFEDVYIARQYTERVMPSGAERR